MEIREREKERERENNKLKMKRMFKKKTSIEELI